MKDILLTTRFGTLHLEISEPDPATGLRDGEVLAGFADAAEPLDDGVDSVDFIQTVILAHACAGVDVESAAYIQGIETILEGIQNHLL